MANRIDTSALEKRAPRKAPVRKPASKVPSKTPGKAPLELGRAPIPLGKLNDFWLYEILDGQLESGHLELIDAIVIPASIEGLGGQFANRLGQLDGALGERIGEGLSGVFKFGAKSQPDEVELARLVDSKQSPRLIAVHPRLPVWEKNVGAAVTAALRLAVASSARRILLPVPGVGSGQANGTAVGRDFCRAIVQQAGAVSGGKAEIYFCTLNRDARLAIRLGWLGAITANIRPPDTGKNSDPIEPAADTTPVPATRHALRDYSVDGFRADVLDHSKDFVGVGAETHAFAKLAASNKITPPLAIGVFGDWGSGKSYFMSCVQAKIEAFAKVGAADSKSGFHANIVHINFNAWHYIETNLWASLVEFIFAKLEEWLRRANNEAPDSVNSMFDALATSRQLKLETARAVMGANLELHRAQEAVAAAEQVKAEKTASKLTALNALLDHAADITLASKPFNELTEKLDKAGLGEVGANTVELNKLGQQLSQVDGRSRTLWQSGRNLATTWWGWAAIVSLVVLPVAVSLLLDVVVAKTDIALPAISEFFAGTATLLATAAAWIKGFLSVANPALEKAEAFFAAVEQKRIQLEKEATEEEAKAVASAQAELGEAQKTLDAARERLRLAAVQAAEAQNSYQAESARGRLNRFIRDRLADGTYGKHLGLIATIRKDFEQITSLMNQAEPDSAEQTRVRCEREAFDAKVESLKKDAIVDGKNLLSDADLEQLATSGDSKPPKTFERIVLYIDDLDRCPPQKVVEVIQAIHMLLCFRLFVVFVAVDARWVTGALEQTFRGQLRDAQPGQDPSMPMAKAGATAEDYMEKIFQIPYWVRPIEGRAASGFMDKLARDFGIAASDGSSAGPTTPAAAHGTATAAAESTSEGSPEAPAANDDAAPSEPDVALPAANAAPVEGDAASSFAMAEKLLLGIEDLAALAAMAPTIGDSPRRIKRFFNTYLLIQTIAGVMIGNEVTDSDPDLRQQCEDMLGTCTYEQQALALATSLSLSMIEQSCGLSASELAALTDDGLQKLVSPAIGKTGLPKTAAATLGAYIAAKDAANLQTAGLEPAFTFFLPLARRYGFRDLDA